MPHTVPCPYCNAPVPVPQPPPAGGRVFCQRCEEAVTIGSLNGEAPTIAPAPSPAAPSRLSNRAIAGLVVAVMLGMAALGLAFALQTVGFRRANDLKGAQPPEQVPEARSVPPAEWPGLGYLPEDVQAVAGIRIGEALQSTAGKALLARLSLADGKTVLGLAPNEIDDLLIGANFRTLPPRLVIVAHGTVGSPKLSDRTVERHGKTLDRLRLWTAGPEGVAWRPDAHTVVAALLPEDFDHVPAKPRTTAPLPEF